jgi:hypothetical protein
MVEVRVRQDVLTMVQTGIHQKKTTVGNKDGNVCCAMAV